MEELIALHGPLRRPPYSISRMFVLKCVAIVSYLHTACCFGKHSLHFPFLSNSQVIITMLDCQLLNYGPMWPQQKAKEPLPQKLYTVDWGQRYINTGSPFPFKTVSLGDLQERVVSVSRHQWVWTVGRGEPAAAPSPQEEFTGLGRVC